MSNNFLRHRDDAIPFPTKDTSIIREIVHPAHSGAQNQSLAEATLPPNAQTQAHFHPQSEEIYTILRGTGTMALGETTLQVLAGAAIIILPGVPHQIRNIGSEELVFLCCCAPAYAHDDTIFCDDLLY